MKNLRFSRQNQVFCEKPRFLVQKCDSLSKIEVFCSKNQRFSIQERTLFPRFLVQKYDSLSKIKVFQQKPTFLLGKKAFFWCKGKTNKRAKALAFSPFSH